MGRANYSLILARKFITPHVKIQNCYGNVSKTHDYERNLSPMILIGNQNGIYTREIRKSVQRALYENFFGKLLEFWQNAREIISLVSLDTI